MAFTNPFEGLQQLEQFRAQRQQNIQQAEQARLLEQQRQARNALAQQFGPGAADPGAFAAIGQAQAQQGFADANNRRAALGEQAFEQEQMDRARTLIGSAINAVAMAQQRSMETGDPSILQNTLDFVARRTGAASEDIEFVRQGLANGIPKDTLREAFLLSPQNPSEGLPAELRSFIGLAQAGNFTPQELQQAARIQAGLAPRAGSVRVEDIGGVQSLVVPSATGQTMVAPLSTLGQEVDARRQLSEASGTGQNTATVTFERLQQGLDDTDSALQSLEAIRIAQQQIDQGIISGSLANARLAGFRALETLTGIAFDEVQNTEAFLAATGPLVATRIQAFGAGTGLSDADREFATQIAGRDITLSEGGIRRILALNAATEAARIERFNEQRDRFVRRNPDLADIFPGREIPEFAARSLRNVRARAEAERRGQPLPPLVEDPRDATRFRVDDADSEILNEFIGRQGN